MLNSESGSHNPDADAQGTIRFLNQNIRVDFDLHNVGNYNSADEPDLAREHSGANIDRGMNTTICDEGDNNNGGNDNNNGGNSGNHEHVYTHTHGGSNGGSAQQHEHHMQHSHDGDTSAEHDHPLVEYPYEEIHNDGTHPSQTSSDSTDNHDHSLTHSHGDGKGGADQEHEHQMQHSHDGEASKVPAMHHHPIEDYPYDETHGTHESETSSDSTDYHNHSVMARDTWIKYEHLHQKHTTEDHNHYYDHSHGDSNGGVNQEHGHIYLHNHDDFDPAEEHEHDNHLHVYDPEHGAHQNTISSNEDSLNNHHHDLKSEDHDILYSHMHPGSESEHDHEFEQIKSSGTEEGGSHIGDGSTSVAVCDQFLEILPSERDEGSLTVSFFSDNPDDHMSTWSNPVQAFGFYLMGREPKRDVFLDVYDVNNNLIASELTAGEDAPDDHAAIEYISFAVEEGADLISSFVLREPYNNENSSERDIFSIDDLTVVTEQNDGLIRLDDLITDFFIEGKFGRLHLGLYQMGSGELAFSDQGKKVGEYTSKITKIPAGNGKGFSTENISGLFKTSRGFNVILQDGKDYFKQVFTWKKKASNFKTNDKTKNITKKLLGLERKHNSDLNGDNLIGIKAAPAIKNVFECSALKGWNQGLYQLDDKSIVLTKGGLSVGNTPEDELTVLTNKKGKPYSADGVVGAYKIKDGFALIKEKGDLYLSQKFSTKNGMAELYGGAKNITTSKLNKLERRHSLDFNQDNMIDGQKDNSPEKNSLRLQVQEESEKLTNEHIQALTSGEWYGAYLEGIVNHAAEGVIEVLHQPENWYYKFEAKENNGLIVTVSHTKIKDGTIANKELIGSISPSGWMELISLEDNDQQSGWIDLKNGTIDLLSWDHASHGAGEEPHQGNTDKAFTLSLVDLASESTGEQDLFGTLSSKQRKINKQAKKAVNEYAEFLGNGNWAGSSFSGIFSDPQNNGSQEIGVLDGSAVDITFDFDVQENGSLKATRKKANSQGRIIETVDYFGSILPSGNFVLVSRSDNQTALGQISQENHQVKMIITDQELPSGTGEDGIKSQDMAAYLALTDLNSTPPTPNQGNEDKGKPMQADAELSDQYVDFLTGHNWHGAYATGIQTRLSETSGSPEPIEQGIDLESLHYSFENHDDGKFTMEQQLNSNGDTLTKSFIGVTNPTGFFQMASTEENETLTGQIYMDKGTIEFISTVPAHEAPATPDSTGNSDPYEIESCNAFTLVKAES
ncbi:MAG: hypothetical protein AB8E87_08020 [Prochlorococcus sp.]